MYLSDAVRDRIRFYQGQTGMSLWGLFKASGVPMSTLAAFMSKRTELIKLDSLLHICEGFGITITEFFENDIFKEVEQINLALLKPTWSKSKSALIILMELLY